MSSPQHCLAMADEADRLAGIVSYERDKARLRDQAAAWRRMASAMTSGPRCAEAPEPAPQLTSVGSSSPVARTGWLKRRFG